MSGEVELSFDDLGDRGSRIVQMNGIGAAMAFGLQCIQYMSAHPDTVIEDRGRLDRETGITTYRVRWYQRGDEPPAWAEDRALE